MSTGETPTTLMTAWEEDDSTFNDTVLMVTPVTYGDQGQHSNTNVYGTEPSSPFPYSPSEAFSTPKHLTNYGVNIRDLPCYSSPQKNHSEKSKIAQGDKTPPASPRHLGTSDLLRQSVFATSPVTGL